MGLARPLAVSMAVAFSLLGPQGAPAADHRIPVDNTGFSIPAEDCGFPIDVAVVRDKEYYVKVRDNADGSTTFRVTGQLVMSFTNTDTDKTIVRDVGGPGTFTIGADGGIFDTQGRGFSWLSPQEQAATGLPGVVFTYGHVVVPVDENIVITGASLSGRWVDGCELLAD